MITRAAYVLASILALAAASPTRSWAQAGRSYNFAHIRYAEGDVTLQRALELEAEEAGTNVPVLPGDRLWTTLQGRAEILFADGSLLQMDERTKVDFIEFGDTAGAETLLRLWNGSLFLRVVDASATSYRIDTPSGSIFPVSEGLFRVDVDETGTATLSVYEGVAEIASESGSVLVRTGQRSFVQPGLRPESPFAFNTALYDAFASWVDGREQLYRSTRTIEGVPNEVAVYSGELDHYGSWRREASFGLVWYPSVSVGWSPYSHGRWCYTSFGWTWISYEPWGWAPYHYGRWGYGSLGWYWIPGAYWGPAWVSWAFGPTWVGWSPLGYYNRPIYPYRSVFDYRGGHAKSRGHGWNFAGKDHFRPTRPVPVERTRLRVEDVRATAGQGRLLESGAVLDRDLRPRATRGVAVARPSTRTAPATPQRLGLQRSPRGAIVTRGGASASSPGTSPRGSTVTRVTPSGSLRIGGAARDTNSARSVSSTRGAPERAQQPSPGRSGSPSTRSRIGVAPQRGERSNTRSGAVSPGSSTSFVRPSTPARAPSTSVPSPSRTIDRSRGTRPAPTVTPSRPTSEVKSGSAVVRSKGSSAGSKEFFGRGASNLGRSSSSAGSRAAPRATAPSRNRPSPKASSSRSSSGSSNRANNRSGNGSGNRNSSRRRN